MKRSLILCTLAAVAVSLGSATPAKAQGLGLGLQLEYRQETRQHQPRHRFHPHYYERGYDRQRFAYHPAACARRSNGLGLGLGGVAQIDVSLGHGWSQCDRDQFSYAHDNAWRGRHVSYWQNPETGRRGTIRPHDHYRSHGRDCLSGEAETYDSDGNYQRFGFESCRDGSGQWQFEHRNHR